MPLALEKNIEREKLFVRVFFVVFSSDWFAIVSTEDLSWQKVKVPIHYFIEACISCNPVSLFYAVLATVTPLLH